MFLIIFILIIYLKDKVNGVEIKTAIIGGDFNLATLMFVNDGDFTNLGKRTDSQWDEVPQQKQRIVKNWIGGLIL